MSNSKTLDIRNNILSLVEDYSRINFKEKDFIPGVSEVPVSGKFIGSTEVKNMVDASLDCWLTTGRYNTEFDYSTTYYYKAHCSNCNKKFKFESSKRL